MTTDETLTFAEKIVLDYVQDCEPAMTHWPLDDSDKMGRAFRRLVDLRLITVEEVMPGLGIGVAKIRSDGD